MKPIVIVMVESTQDSSSLQPFFISPMGKGPHISFSISFLFPSASFSSQKMLGEILLASNSKLVYTISNLKAKNMPVLFTAFTVPSTCLAYNWHSL